MCIVLAQHLLVAEAATQWIKSIATATSEAQSGWLCAAWS